MVSRDDLDFIAALCVQHNVYVLSDEGETHILILLRKAVHFMSGYVLRFCTT